MPTPEFWTMPGWRALETALAEAFPGRPQAIARAPESADSTTTFATTPLAAVFIHQLADAWHYLSFGLSELNSKRSPDPQRSGWGFELSLRLRRGPEAQPPTWPVDLLQRLAALVWKRRAGFAPRHHLPLGGPLVAGSQLTAIVFALDPSLPRLDTTHGEVLPLQIVGLTGDEESMLPEWSSEGLLAALGEQDPTLLTDPSRGSLLADPVLGPLLRERAASEGSQATGIVPETLRWRSTTAGFVIELGPDDLARANLPRFLRGRTRLGRPFTLRGQVQSVELRGGAVAGAHADGERLLVDLDPAARLALEHALPGLPADTPWSTPALPGLTLVLVPDT